MKGNIIGHSVRIPINEICLCIYIRNIEYIHMFLYVCVYVCDGEEAPHLSRKTLMHLQLPPVIQRGSCTRAGGGGGAGGGAGGREALSAIKDAQGRGGGG